MIAGLLLAAGRSSRFGGDKLLAPLHGRPVLYWSASALAAGGLDVLYLVVPPDGARRVSALGGTACQVVEHRGWDAGMASSIQAGLAAMPDTIEAVVVALADQPGVAPGVVRCLCDRWREGGADAVVPRYQDGPGHPVLFGRATFGVLFELRGDVGARTVLDALGGALAHLAVEGSRPVDVDTPEALDALAVAWRP